MNRTPIVALGLVAMTAAVLVNPDAPSTIQSPNDTTLLQRATAACLTTRPYAVVAVHDHGAEPALAPAVVAVRVGGDATGPVVLATQAEVGSVYGLAWDHARGVVYAAAHYRRGLPFGPGGTGAIYRIDVATGSIDALANLSAGPNRHGLDGDPGAPAFAGRTSLGDLDIAADGSELYATNLFDGRIARIGLPEGVLIGTQLHGAARERWSTDARPFGLGVDDGWVYHGVVNSRATSPTASPIFDAIVYRSRPGERDAETVLRFGLEYARGVAWSAWDDAAGGDGRDEPLLADIGFAASGAPILGLRDRRADDRPDCPWLPACGAGGSLGDLLATVARESVGWRVVSNPPWYGDADASGLDTSWGSLAVLPSQDGIVAPGRPHERPAADQGVRVELFRYANGSGRALGSTIVISGTADARLGAGDVEVLCAPGAVLPPEALATATAEAGAAATATAAERGNARATARIPTLTAHAPTAEARATVAVQTATALGPTLAVAGPTRTARGTAAAATATAFLRQMTVVAPTHAALSTAAAAATPRAPAKATEAALAAAMALGSCGGANPYLVTTCFTPALDGRGDAYDAPWLEGQPMVVVFDDSQPEDASRHRVLAWQPEVGAVFGLAHDIPRGHVYAGAYAKRLAAFGPLGPGGLYRIDLATGRTVPWASVFAGFDLHRMASAFDLPMATVVGRTAFGDVEFAPDRDEVLAMNLFDRLIYRFHAPDGALLGAFPHGGAGETWEADARPFALAYHGGWLYHGVVDARESDVRGDRPMNAYVYRSRADGTDMAEVARLDMGYVRAQPWQAWDPTFDRNVQRFEPLFADIEFREDGDLVLGFRDRLGDAAILVAGGGDMVATLAVGDRFIALPEPEFYMDNIQHDESSWGSLAALPWLDQVVSTVIDPITIWSGGAAWFDNVSGWYVGRETIYAGANVTFGKASGLGDLEAMCEALTPTPSATPTASPTGTLSATPTPTITRTPTSTPTATAGHYAIYLPYGDALFCRPDATFADIVLVIDLSTSMDRPTREGRTKRAAAIDAARQFAALLDLADDATVRHDRVALVGFNAAAWTELDLSGDRSAVDAALDRLAARSAQGTRLDLALAEGQAALDRSARAGNEPVLILLTDGLPNLVPTPVGGGRQEDTVLVLADAAKAAGTRVFTVGLGEADDVLAGLLELVASAPDAYYFAPDGEDLAAIYRAIAGRITDCP